ncbi:universal stress protein [Thermococcus sp.]
MSIFSTIINRRFKHIAGNRYEKILKSYKEFFLTEEEISLPVIKSILMPVDRSVKTVPKEIYEALSACEDAEVTVVYIMSEEACTLIRQTLGEEASKEFKTKAEERGRRLLEKIALSLENAGLKVRTRMFFGNKSEDVIKLSRESDLLVIPRIYGSEITKTTSITPIVMKIVQHVNIPVIVY